MRKIRKAYLMEKIGSLIRNYEELDKSEKAFISL